MKVQCGKAAYECEMHILKVNASYYDKFSVVIKVNLLFQKK